LPRPDSNCDLSNLCSQVAENRICVILLSPCAFLNTHFPQIQKQSVVGYENVANIQNGDSDISKNEITLFVGK
jgi:hypothetical protein